MATTNRTGQKRSRQEATRAREAEWRRRFAEQRRSGLSHSEYCRREGLSTNAYFWWRREVLQRDARRRGERAQADRPNASPALIPVRLPAPSRGGAFEVLLTSQRVVRVPPDFDADSLRRLVAVLEEEERC